MNSVLGREPVLWLALIQAGLALGIGFGLKITTEQMAMILAFTGAVLAFVARAQVTPQAPATAKDITNYIEKADPAIIDKADAKKVTAAIDVAAAAKP